MSVEPATKRDEVTDLINQLARNPSPTEMDFRRVSRANDELKAIELAIYYMHAGMIAAVRGDAEQVVRNHTNSIRLDDDCVMYTNYALSLRRIADYEASKDIALQALKLHPGSPSAFVAALDAMKFCGDFSELDSVVRRFAAAHPDFDEREYQELITAYKVRDGLARLGVPGREFHSLMRRIQDVFSRIDVRPWLCSMDFGSFDEVGHLTVCFDVPNLTLEQSILANDALCELLVMADDLEHWDRFVLIVKQADLAEYERVA